MQKIDLKELFPHGEAASEKLYKTLLKAIADAHIKEFDYLKFKQSVSNMIEMGMDEATSIKSAFTTASTMGLTKDKLLKTAFHYQSSLTKEKEKFAQALKNKIAKDIDGKRVEAKKFVDEIASHKSKIAQLEKEIGIYQKKVDSVESVVAKAKEKIDATRDSFKTTFDDLYSQIENDVERIEENL